MARTTRLYQRARSPLIQGRSRRERPWPVDVAVGEAWGLVVLFALVVSEGVSRAGDAGSAWSAFGEALVPVAIGAAAVFAGAAASVVLAKAWGAIRPGRIAAFVCAAVAFVYWTAFGASAAGWR
ncbi:MAG: hypothetical protein QMD96_03640 [Anaerosomatales bacterium]|nr:hypothetical protein [Anaerosomatales bacterium]